VPIGGNAVTGIALLLHEIATNAAKYGALSTESGHVNVSWSVWKDELLLAWQDFPRWNREGMTVNLSAPLERLTI
jgi:two-component system CheB/CheR fusion protein